MLRSRLSTQIRLAALLAALTTVFGVMTLIAPAAHAVTVTVTDEKGLTFTANDAAPEQGATVSAYDASFGTDVTIPDSVTIEGNEYAVKTIGFQAFLDKGLTSVTLEANLTTIGQLAFQGNSLTNFTIPDGVTTIGSNAFAGNDLTSIVIPDSVTSIGQNVFAINNIATATISNNLTTIPESTFETNALTSITIPDGVTSIGNFAFYGNALVDVTIPSNVTSIANRSFEHNANLASVTFAGAAPTVFDGGTADESFDTASGAFVVHYPAKYADPPAAGGYTGPTWRGYASKPYLTGLAPTITGTVRETYTLTAVPGPVDSNATVAYQWKANGADIVGAVNPTLKLAKAQAGRRITVTATATYSDAEPLVKTSPTTRVVSSPYKRIVLSKSSVKRGTSFRVTATGFKAHQTVRIRLNNVTRYSGRADAYGVVDRTVSFTSTTPYGRRSVKVQYKSGGTWHSGISTSVRYYK